jgi:hypothetical protein
MRSYCLKQEIARGRLPRRRVDYHRVHTRHFAHHLGEEDIEVSSVHVTELCIIHV